MKLIPQTVYIDTDGYWRDLSETNGVKKLENVYVLTKTQVEELISKTWKESDYSIQYYEMNAEIDEIGICHIPLTKEQFINKTLNQ